MLPLFARLLIAIVFQRVSHISVTTNDMMMERMMLRVDLNDERDVQSQATAANRAEQNANSESITEKQHICF